MGYIENKTLITLFFSLGVGLVISTVIYIAYLTIKKNRNRWKTNISMNPFVVTQRDNFTKWIDSIDKRLRKNSIKAKVKNIVFISVVISIITFFVSLNIFKNITAAIFLSATFFVIPEYILFIYESKRKMMIEDQMITAIKIFTAEFMKTKNIEKSFAEISTKVLDPIGGYFSDAYIDILTGHPFNNVIARLSTRIDNEYWQMFIQLIYQLNDNSRTINLFTDLVTRIEKSINLSRNNEMSLAGERILALIMAILPLPTYYFMSSVVPETVTFVVETMAGRTLITASFISIFLFVFLDKMLRRVE